MSCFYIQIQVRGVSGVACQQIAFMFEHAKISRFIKGLRHAFPRIFYTHRTSHPAAYILCTSLKLSCYNPLFMTVVATVGLGVSDFLYRIPHHSCFSCFRHRFENTTFSCVVRLGSAIAMAHGHSRKQYTTRSAHRQLLALQLLFSRFSHLFQSHCILFFARLPSHIYTYLATFPSPLRVSIE